jgi:hypothetical protein
MRERAQFVNPNVLSKERLLREYPIQIRVRDSVALLLSFDFSAKTLDQRLSFLFEAFGEKNILA